jgi:hypothetical protein
MILNDSNEKSHAEASTTDTVSKRKRLDVRRSLFSMCEACQMVDIEPPQPHFTLFCSTNTTARNCIISAQVAFPSAVPIATAKRSWCAQSVNPSVVNGP